MKPTLAAPRGPWNGTPEIDRAAEAPIKEAISGLIFLCIDKLNANLDVKTSWRLNEKSYGDCEGVCRDDLIKHMSKDYVSELRRSFFMLPPKLENEMKYDFVDYQIKTSKHYYENNLHKRKANRYLIPFEKKIFVFKKLLVCIYYL